MKTRLVVNRQTGEIICTADAKGKTHEFRLFEKSVGKAVLPCIKIQVDGAYQGITRLLRHPERNREAGDLRPMKKLKTGVFPVSAFLLNK